MLCAVCELERSSLLDFLTSIMSENDGVFAVFECLFTTLLLHTD